MEKDVIWKNEKEIAKVKSNYATFTKAFNEAVCNLERTFKIVLKEDDVKFFFESRKCLTPFIDAISDYLWERRNLRIVSPQELFEQVRKELSGFVRSTCSLYYISPEYVEIVDCRLRVLEDKLDVYLMEQHSLSINTENMRRIWNLAIKACDILNELETATVESSKNWFVTHATAIGGGSALIHLVDGKYSIAGEEMANIK